MCLVSPLAGSYYLSRGTRNEQCRVKMVAADDESTVDIIVEGDQEELDRFAEVSGRQVELGGLAVVSGQQVELGGLAEVQLWVRIWARGSRGRMGRA